VNIDGSCWERLRQVLLVQDNAVAGFCEEGNETRGPCAHWTVLHLDS